MKGWPLPSSVKPNQRIAVLGRKMTFMIRVVAFLSLNIFLLTNC